MRMHFSPYYSRLDSLDVDGTPLLDEGSKKQGQGYKHKRILQMKSHCVLFIVENV